MGADESNVTNPYQTDKIAEAYKEKKSEQLMDQSKASRVISGGNAKATLSKIKQDKDVNNKLNGKV